jgi:aldose 1-epimerase
MRDYHIFGTNLEVVINTLGATITEVYYKGVLVTLSYSDRSRYLKSKDYLGGTIAPIAGRIKGGKLRQDYKFQLEQNDFNKNTLHSGDICFAFKEWEVDISENNRLRLYYETPEIKDKTLGDVSVSVDYKIVGDKLEVVYHAYCDYYHSPFSITNHSYFNLSGKLDEPNSINDHYIKINSSKYLEVDEELLPIIDKDVVNTPFDFTKYTYLGDVLKKYDQSEYFKYTNGIDHSYLLTKTLIQCSSAYCPSTGIQLDLITNQPCLQFYTGNFLNMERSSFPFRSGFCFEPQGVPNSCNDTRYDNMWTKKPYIRKSIYSFSTHIDNE